MENMRQQGRNDDDDDNDNDGDDGDDDDDNFAANSDLLIPAPKI